jgi:hypothetical protein
MSAPTPGSSFERLLAPRALLLGVAAAFLGCCLAGHLASRRNHFQHFERFHMMLSPETLYYPTVGQVRALARSRCDRGKVLVIVGGSSVLHGTGQRAGHVWTDRLQEELGDGYQVLNLALRGGRPAEYGAVMAEVLARDFPSIILITDVEPGAMHPEPDGCQHKFFFWDAYYKGLLLRDGERDRRLAELIPEAEQREQELGRKKALEIGLVLGEVQEELRTKMALDSALYFSDLWNAVAYERCHTVWTKLTGQSFTRARRNYPDADPGAPAVPYTEDLGHAMAVVRSRLVGACVKDAGGQWVEDSASPVWSFLEKTAATCFPEPTRGRTLTLVRWYSPYYVNQMSTDERTCFTASSHATARHLAHLGFTALEFGGDYTVDDYFDLQHLTEPGGHKLAAAVAPKVRELAQRLGYVPAAAAAR